MQCENCGHKPELHGENGCRMRILTGWNPETQRWASHRECPCVDFVGPPEPPPDACPHEFVKTSPHCVHCGAIATENAR